jgi:anti-sigma factor RsiW
MTCTDFLAKLTDFFDGTVPPDLMAEVQQHIAECKHCEVVLDSTTKTINIYRDHELYDFPPDLQQRIHSAVMARCAGLKVPPQADKHLSKA